MNFNFDLDYYLEWVRRNPWVGLLFIFQFWMLFDAVRRGEWFWAFLILFVPPPIMPLWYFLWVYRAQPLATQGFELPGTGSRMRIKQLEALIHNLDKPHHYLELGDIYFRKGNLAKAELNYRASLEREPQDIDARAHLGQCLLRQKRAEEASPILYQVCKENPKHDYGYSLMAYAEALGALGDTDGAITVWQEVLKDHSYARARVQLGQLYLLKNRRDLAELEFRGTINDDRHAPGYQRKRDRWWVWKAKRLLA
ncbi:MAG TPA: tetratricopeptide repeat protein [Verrucomicrobiae bacterium]|jgi:tetratricopeptide (TPR) repeat protein|nr:tetratricopeptide repeat protein [Verrucomicrobiae bacterium]